MKLLTPYVLGCLHADKGMPLAIRAAMLSELAAAQNPRDPELDRVAADMASCVEREKQLQLDFSGVWERSVQLRRKLSEEGAGQ